MIPYALVLLLLAAPATTVAGAATPSIDWAECNDYSELCLFAKKCRHSSYSDTSLVEYPEYLDIVLPCHAGLSVRPLNDKIWFVRLQAGSPTPASSALDPAKGIQFFAGKYLLFGCSLNGSTVELTGNAEDTWLKTELYGADSYLNSTGGYCTILINNALSLTAYSAEFKMVYFLDGQEIVVKTSGRTTIFSGVSSRIYCDSFTLKSDNTSDLDGYKRVRIPDVIKDPPSWCDDIPFAKLFVGREQATHFECDRAKKKYFFNTSLEGSAALRENHEVFCAIPIGTTCKDLIGRSRNTPKYSQDPTTGQTSLKCDVPSHKMLINDEFYTDMAPECRHIRESGNGDNDGVWHARPATYMPFVSIGSAICSDQIRCDVISSFNSTAPEGELYENVYLEEGVNLSCADGATLRVRQKPDELAQQPESIVCNVTIGVYLMATWRFGPGEDVDEGANVYCEVSPEPDPPAGADLGLIVGVAGGAFLLILIVVIAGLFWLLIIRRRSKKPGKVLKDLSLTSIVSKVNTGRRKKKPTIAELKKLDPLALHQVPPNVRRAYYRYLLRGKVRLPAFMDIIESFFQNSLNPADWKCFLPFLFFLERDFFHTNQTTDHTVVEREKVIPGFCYERLRLFLLDRADKWLEKWGYEHVTGEAESTVFVRGICLVLMYKLNIMKKKEKRKIVNRVTDIFLTKGMDQVDPSRFAIWGILHHEETGSKRRRGVHDYFGRATGQRIMFDYLYAEFTKLLKQPLEPRPQYGSKMQHVLFAMGCALEREPMAAVWKVMKEDKRFLAQDFMWAMYGRDWLWDGAWVCMFQNPPEHHLFCGRFSQECKAYKELAEMLTRYWPDKYSLGAKYGVCFEGFMRSFDLYIFDEMLKHRYQWFERWEEKRHAHGLKVSRWLMVNDPREFHEYPTTEDPSRVSTRASTRTRDATDVSRAQSTTEASAPSRRR